MERRGQSPARRPHPVRRRQEASARKNLATVRDLLTLPIDRFERLLVTMQDSQAAGGLVARAANRHLAKSDREASGVLSSAQRHTHFLDSPRMTAVMDRSDFAFAALKEQTATVFLVLPPDRISTYSRWLRLMVSQAMTELARSSVQPPAPVLFLLDEFAALGRLEPVERAMGLMAGYGVQLWPILQDLHQLRGTYGTRAGTFLSNAGLVQVFNVNDTDTADWVSRALGEATEAYETGSLGETRHRTWQSAGSTSTRHRHRRPSGAPCPADLRRSTPAAARQSDPVQGWRTADLRAQAPLLRRSRVSGAAPRRCERHRFCRC